MFLVCWASSSSASENIPPPILLVPEVDKLSSCLEGKDDDDDFALLLGFPEPAFFPFGPKAGRPRPRPSPRLGFCTDVASFSLEIVERNGTKLMSFSNSFFYKANPKMRNPFKKKDEGTYIYTLFGQREPARFGSH